MWKYLLIVKIVKKNYQRNIFYFFVSPIFVLVNFVIIKVNRVWPEIESYIYSIWSILYHIYVFSDLDIFKF